MKKFFLIVIALFSLVPVCYADDYDTNYLDSSVHSSTSSSSSNATGVNNYRYWDYYKVTGTRYVIRVYDWNTEKYIAVPKEYYINHIYEGKKEVMYLGVDKASNGSYTAVRKANSIFQDTSYSHIITWFNNKKVSNFGLSHNDIVLLANIVKESAIANGNIALSKSMQNVIDGTVPFDVRAEILFLVKIPGQSGSIMTGRVVGNGSIENYTFDFYANQKGKWRKDYFTYLEAKAICYAFGDDCGMTMKAYWLDKIACALYEDDYEYVYANNQYQCSCDLYRRKFGAGVSYWLNGSNKITINQQAYEPRNRSDRWYMYLVPGRCGIPIVIENTTYYLTPGKTYPNVNGKKLSVHSYIKFSDTSKGIRAQNTDYLGVVTNDATKPVLYEGWDYITNNLAATLVIAVDRNNGNIISVNNVPYSKFDIVEQGNYEKTAWEIEGYNYIGYYTQNKLSFPSMPFNIQSTENKVIINMSAQDIEVGARKQVVFFYERENNNNDDNAVRLTIYKMQDGVNSMLYRGEYLLDEEGCLSINLYDRLGINKYSTSMEFDLLNGYKINTFDLEQKLDISADFEYVGNLIKSHPEYYLTYLGESLQTNSGDIYNLKEVKENKVHIILGYKYVEPPPTIVEGVPELKVSYVDENGNLIPGKQSKETKESIGKDIVTTAEDFRSEYYMYMGYTYYDTQNKFGNIIIPLNIKGKEGSITTKFTNGNARRHIVFIYKKIDLKFEIDVIMDPNDLENQFIGQKEDEDYWVLDDAGKVYIKGSVTGDEGLNILNYTVKLKIPFDTFMNGDFIKANSINNITSKDLSNMIVTDRLIVPIWVEEKEYNLTATVEANIEGFGIFSANKQDDVEIVGRLYDFTITNLDGSSKIGDQKWYGSLFADKENEYKADKIPIGQIENQPKKYNYGIKLGTSFYFSINTKGLKNDSISIVPKFLYVSEDGNVLKEVDIYINDNGKYKNILSDELSKRYMKLRDDNILKPDVVKEVERAFAINKIFDRYNYLTTTNRNIGTLANTILSKFVSLPYLNYINEFKNLYGINALDLSNKTENELLINASHWYGRYALPASSKIVEKGEAINGKGYDDGYLIVCFKIISLDKDGKEYLDYNLPASITQWQRENLNQIINLPKIDVLSNNKVTLETLKEGYAPVIVYQVGISTSDNNTSVGTH